MGTLSQRWGRAIAVLALLSLVAGCAAEAQPPSHSPDLSSLAVLGLASQTQCLPDWHACYGTGYYKDTRKCCTKNQQCKRVQPPSQAAGLPYCE